MQEVPGLALRFLDLFAGAGGLSEGFIQAGFEPVAHVEMDPAASFTLRTRMAYHHLRKVGDISPYIAYLKQECTRSDFYRKVPARVIDSVIHSEIGDDTLPGIFDRIDAQLRGKSLDLIVGGPPCQAYSIAGRSRSPNGMVGDKRNYLFLYYGEFLKRYRPRYFVFENVTGLLTAKDLDRVRYLDKMKKVFDDCGYEATEEILKAEDFGVPQYRTRVILVGKRTRSSFEYPMPSKIAKPRYAWDFLQDFPKIKALSGNPWACAMKPDALRLLDGAMIRDEEVPVTHFWSRPQRDEDLEIYRLVVEHWNKHGQRLRYEELPTELQFHKNTTDFADRFKVVAKYEPSHTVVAHIARDGHYYIHPDLSQNRSLTPREAARIQTFPDNYHFESMLGTPSRTPAYRQIGNAVPVMLARKIAEKLNEVW
ncbi:MAG TPA: DNA cytosine methyltransferase [Fibrobacteria bacterium]|nr:DNA cytosine methyltransferase [Fibrobacteria bacterium]